VKRLAVDLIDRVLRFDGVSVISPEMVARCLLLGVSPAQLRVTETGWEVEQFNAQVPEELEIKLDQPEPISLDFRWQLPDEYLTMDLWERIAAAYIKREDELAYSVQEEDEALCRMEEEYDEIKQRGMIEFVKTVIYVIDTFRANNVVWGVGRGSSCASYVLFLLGLHSVDCIKLQVPAAEFFHD
jgi:DNA polymerase III alpha subunit